MVLGQYGEIGMPPWLPFVLPCPSMTSTIPRARETARPGEVGCGLFPGGSDVVSSDRCNISLTPTGSLEIASEFTRATPCRAETIGLLPCVIPCFNPWLKTKREKIILKKDKLDGIATGTAEYPSPAGTMKPRSRDQTPRTWDHQLASLGSGAANGIQQLKPMLSQ